ncbi:hypothetical protein JG687_00010213 [Phytophthora cactorum]|uniref:HAT C-terminal dimerisation domain-containing protein n=1 Tax=Phytophthora cactorum TaxID=29920 RepID=A0A8T1U965_9STRA|nr:hypothetical protein JG687_00010213 [Phytophthora cactorum]
MFKWMRGTFMRVKPNEIEGGLWEYWQYMAQAKPNSLLPKVAIAVLSVAVSTAKCERLFNEELDIGHTEADTSSNSTCRSDQDYEDDNEFEEVPAAVIHEFPTENVSNCTQEVKLSGFRAQKANLEELFAVISTLMQPHD